MAEFQVVAQRPAPCHECGGTPGAKEGNPCVACGRRPWRRAIPVRAPLLRRLRVPIVGTLVMFALAAVGIFTLGDVSFEVTFALFAAAGVAWVVVAVSAVWVEATVVWDARRAVRNELWDEIFRRIR